MTRAQILKWRSISYGHDGKAGMQLADFALSGHLLALVTRPTRVPPRSSKKVVLVGLASDLAIAVSKFIAAAVTHSSAMFAEALHSTADTGNELLLLIGMRRSTRPRDALHPFGHGKALYFYSLLVAVCIFRIGGGSPVTVVSPSCFMQRCQPTWAGIFTVLGIAAAFDFYSWRVSYRELLARKDLGEILTMQLGPDQALLTVGIRFPRGLTLEQVEGAIEGMKNALHNEGMKNALHNKDSASTQIFIQPVSHTPSGHSEATQRENGKENRNDRLIAVAEGSVLYAGVNQLSDLEPTVLKQIEQFFTNYQKVRNIDFEVIERGGSQAGLALLRECTENAA